MRIGLLASVGRTLDAFFPQIIDSWESAGHQVFPAAGESSNLRSFTPLSGLTRSPSIRSLSAVRQINSWVNENAIDVVVTNTATASTLARVARLKAPVVYFCHGLHWSDEENRSDRVWQLVERSLLRKTRAVIVLNSHDQEWFESRTGIPVKRLKYGIGLDLDHFKRLPSAPGTREILWVGEFSHRKNPIAAVEAFALIVRLVPEARMTMLGSGPLEAEVRAAVANRGLEAQIELPGRVDPLEYLSKATCLLHTSHWEGLARVLLESAAVGRPAIGFDVKGVRDAPNVAVVPHGDIEALAVTTADSLRGETATTFVDPTVLGYARVADDLEQFLTTVAP